MARLHCFRSLTLLALLAAPLASVSLAQEPETPPPAPKEAPEAPPRPPRPPTHPRREDRERWFKNEKLTPEQRKKFEENYNRWKEMPPELRMELRKNDENRRMRMRKEIDDAITKSGLELSPERRRLFVEKFTRERRSIEERLRKEMDKKRGEEVKQLIENLTGEFKAMPPEPPPEEKEAPTAPKAEPKPEPKTAPEPAAEEKGAEKSP